MRIEFLTLCAAMFCCQTIFAGVTITGTRIIFPSNQNTVTVQLNNPDERPALVQAWLDDGDPRQIPEAEKIPFVLTPPLTQIAAKKGQMIRLIAKDTAQLPKDRESLYWFNILDIPPSAGEDVPNKLQVSIRSRIKLFYRPVHLDMTQEKAFSMVQFQYVASNKSVVVNNPSPYYLNFYDVELSTGKEHKTYSDVLMVAPYSSATFTPETSFKPTKLIYKLINDYGANQSYSAPLE
jgi:fimbrial chaperone protein/chaperone protein EcpD